jgi:hypothetical protein
MRCNSHEGLAGFSYADAQTLLCVCVQTMAPGIEVPVEESGSLGREGLDADV